VLTNLPYANNTFDLVFSADVLEHIHEDEAEAVVAELVRVSRRHLVLFISLRPHTRVRTRKNNSTPRRSRAVGCMLCPTSFLFISLKPHTKVSSGVGPAASKGNSSGFGAAAAALAAHPPCAGGRKLAGMARTHQDNHQSLPWMLTVLRVPRPNRCRRTTLRRPTGTQCCGRGSGGRRSSQSTGRRSTTRCCGPCSTRTTGAAVRHGQHCFRLAYLGWHHVM